MAEVTNGSGKRKAADGQAEASKKSKTGGQQTIEDTLQPHDTKAPAEQDDGVHVEEEKAEPANNKAADEDSSTEKPAKDGGNEDAQPEKKDSHEAQDDNIDEVAASGSADTNGAIKEDKAREEAMPSNILEKGIIYFFTRGRVGVEELESVKDLQRSHFVLRPIPDGGKIGDGKIDDLKTARLIALPKKVWPKSGNDKFMAFVESAKASVKDLKENFLRGSEGVYAITSTGDRGESHLVYMLTIPDKPGELQEDIGIREKGSFVISLKNPEVKGPANAALDQKPEFPSEFIEEFRNRSWMPVHPKHLDYANAQMLLIGEDLKSGHALDATKKDEQDDKKETPKEEMEKLEHEDEIRVKHLKGDDTIYTDLGISKSEYPAVATTW